MPVSNQLTSYRRKRNFRQTPEPAGNEVAAGGQALSFVVQKHHARQLHYDFRLELDGTLKSWAVPKGPSLDPADKRMAVEVEDHPIAYRDFEGEIPPGQYGAGHVAVWDRGEWLPLGDARAGYRDGKLEFELHGAKLRGRWALVRMRRHEGERQTAWLLMKSRDAHARADYDVTEAEPDSVARPSARRGAARSPASASAPAPPPRIALPEQLSPQLATLVAGIPKGGDWLYEIKFDGYRLLTRADARSVRCLTRNGKDWSHKLPHIVSAIRALKLGGAWLDGEIVVADENGVPDFQALQNAFESRQTARIRYHLFDLPFDDRRDLREWPLEQRRARLRERLATAPSDALSYSETFDEDPKVMLASARAAGLEGLIGKRRGSFYRSQRSTDWIKLKTKERQEFIIGGFTEPRGTRRGIGALLLGVYDDDGGALRYAGNVGSGFDDKMLASLRRQLDALATDRPPFADPPRRAGIASLPPHWVEPRLIAEVSFAQWTQAGHLRQPVFHGLREDKAAGVQIGKERAMDPARVATPARANKAAAAPRLAPRRGATALRVTHPERVVDDASGTTKGELVAYYAAVSSLMLSHLRARPMALLRAPTGVNGAFFFQKHLDAGQLPELERLDPTIDPDHEPLLAVGTQRALLAAAQMNVFEFHTWNATVRAPDRPDRIVFDLDPGQGVTWPQLRDAALALHAFLDELGLASFVKTSGGKGLHVVVPVAPRFGWDVVKDFSQAVVVHVAGVLPKTFVAKSGPKNRIGRIFVDYLRNGFGATTACAWSARARPGLGISVPVAWDELPVITGAAHWTVGNAAERLPIGNAPWGAYASRARQGLTAAMKAIGFDVKAAR